jgi:hypothetical protein
VFDIVDTRLSEYEEPQVTSYTDDEILEELGEAQAYGEPEPPAPPTAIPS